MSVEQHPALRASDRDRDDMLVRLHTAFAEGRLDEPELDERIDRVLAARTHADLGAVAADLPSARDAAPCPGTAPAGRFQIAYKTSVTRAGRWRLPERFTTVVYKGTGTLDLQAAELDGPVTTLRVLAYKSTVEIIAPPGVRVEADGAGVSTEVHGDPPAGAPVVHVRGYAYKGAIRVKGLIRRL
ncbi:MULTISPECIES: DUF1707 SHOCT-like domain-containing protein [Actinomadura]|uniref:DUF1707 domain-containing protein n=1 Tax=Actinomadura geliboluensis TaxID=882440 RepID=A0A5S4GBY4_9ACTN|nr:DUF1707 domain-containing protein [Actinomadura geliboluensis]TMR30536.1 DUF1707 domain-containing protein [Actinomadura geliboluensis]